MPPKQPHSTRGSSSRSTKLRKPTSTVVRGRLQSGFRHEDEEQWFEAYFQSRVVICERPLGMTECSPTPAYLLPILRRPGWSSALGKHHVCNASMVREFYASLMCLDGQTYSYEAYVRGKKIAFNPASVGEILGLQPYDNFECPYGLTNAPSGSEVSSALTNGQVTEFPATRLNARLLTPEYRLLHLLIVNVILPTTYKAGLDLDHARVVYAFGTNKLVSLPHLFVVAIKSVAWLTSNKIGLKCGGLITSLCTKSGVKIRNTDEFIKQASEFGDKSVARSLGQHKSINKRSRIVESENEQEVEEENEEEESESEGGSSGHIFPRTKHSGMLPQMQETMERILQNQENYQQESLRAQNETALQLATINARLERLEWKMGSSRSNRRNSS